MKQCPFCKKENADAAENCSCGYIFNQELNKKKTLEKDKNERIEKRHIKFSTIFYAIILPILLLTIYKTIRECSGSDFLHKSEAKASNEQIENKCIHSAKIGTVDICLPEIDGMNECYTMPNVKPIADQMEYNANTTIALYVNDNTYADIENFGTFSTDDYFKIFYVNESKNYVADRIDLENATKAYEDNYFKNNWESIKSEIKSTLDFLSVGQPVLIESYSINPDVSTLVLLLKVQAADVENVLITTFNIVLVKKRLFMLCYYKNYDGEESIKKTKAKTDYITLMLIDENK